MILIIKFYFYIKILVYTMQCFCIKNVNDIFRGKIFIENLLIKHEEIEKEMELNDFIFKYFNISKYVYLHGNDIFPFWYYKLYDEEILIYSEEKSKDLILNKLKSINYDFSSLTEVSNIDFITKYDNFNNLDMFIINNKYYK